MIPGAFPVLSGGAAKTYAFKTSQHSTSVASSFTFSNVDIGFADPTRVVVIGVSYYEFDTAVNLNSVVIGSTTATSQVTRSQAVDNNNASFIFANLSSASIATGTSATITVTFSRVIDFGCSIGVWALYNLQSATPVATASASSTTTAASSVSFSAQPEDIFCAVMTGRYNPGNATWTGVTEDYESTGTLLRSGGSVFNLSTGTRTITAANSAGRSALVAAQWR